MKTYTITNRFFGLLDNEQYGECEGVMVKRDGCVWISLETGKALYGNYEYK